MKLIIYRLLSVFLVIDLFPIVYFLTIGDFHKFYIALAIIPVILIIQILIVKCKCGCRPGLWILAVWTLLLDFELYFADTVLLRRCPKCNRDLKENIYLN